MRVKTVVEENRTLEITLEGEDVALLDIVHHELLEDKRVVFAGVMVPHPLEKRVTMKVQTAKVSPAKAVADSSAKAAKRIVALLEDLKKVVGSGSPSASSP